MKVKMLEGFQGVETSDKYLEPGLDYEVPEELAAYLIEHRKAEPFGYRPEDAAPKAEKPKKVKKSED